MAAMMACRVIPARKTSIADRFARNMILLPGRDILIAQLGDAFALFNSQEQRLYEVDSLAAWTWRHVSNCAAGIGWSQLSAQFSSECKLARPDAEALLDRYVGLGILHACQGSASIFAVALNGSRWMIECPDVLSAELKRLFRGIAIPMEPGCRHEHLVIRLNADRYELTAAGKSIGVVGRAEIIPAIKAFLTEALLQTDFTLALHAALLRLGDRQLLIAGVPGAGKTTLALALSAENGCLLLGDDIVIVDEKGALRGIPFPAAIKRGSWTLLQTIQPEVASRPTYVRSDGKEVRFIPGDIDSDHIAPACSTTMIFLRQNVARRQSLSRMSPLLAFQRLLTEAAAPTRRLTDQAFAALSKAVNISRVYEMEVGPLRQAVEIIRDL